MKDKGQLLGSITVIQMRTKISPKCLVACKTMTLSIEERRDATWYITGRRRWQEVTTSWQGRGRIIAASGHRSRLMVSLLSQEGSSAQNMTNSPAVTPGDHNHFHQWSGEKVSFPATAKYSSNYSSSKKKSLVLHQAPLMVLHSDSGVGILLWAALYAHSDMGFLE